jgi:hypothetical protein
MMLNRIGDVGLAFRYYDLVLRFKTTNYEALFAYASMFESSKSITCFNYELDLLNFACIMIYWGSR